MSIVAELYPVSEDEVEKFAALFPLDADLRTFWLDHGYGFFRSNTSGTLIDGIANRLMHPTDIAETISVAAGFVKTEWPEQAIPFFETLDGIFLFVDGVGRVITDGSGGASRALAGNIAEFVELLVADPLFYEGAGAPEL